MQRGLTGYALAIAIGTVLGIAVVQWRVMRLAIGSLIAGLQTMPSIAWFPLAILFFGLTETAIMFVVVLGAAPSIAAGVITGIDEVPPPLLRAGKMIGATGINSTATSRCRPPCRRTSSGLKQGWAFSWRSLLAGELLVPIGGAVLARRRRWLLAHRHRRSAVADLADDRHLDHRHGDGRDLRSLHASHP